jgi:ribosomal protein L18E
MPALTDWELWAVAAKVMEAEGEDVGEYLVDRVQNLTEAGDHDGVATWLAVADRVQQLRMDRPIDPNEVN